MPVRRPSVVFVCERASITSTAQVCPSRGAAKRARHSRVEVRQRSCVRGKVHTPAGLLCASSRCGQPPVIACCAGLQRAVTQQAPAHPPEPAASTCVLARPRTLLRQAANKFTDATSRAAAKALSLLLGRRAAAAAGAAELPRRAHGGRRLWPAQPSRRQRARLRPGVRMR